MKIDLEKNELKDNPIKKIKLLLSLYKERKLNEVENLEDVLEGIIFEVEDLEGQLDEIKHYSWEEFAIMFPKNSPRY